MLTPQGCAGRRRRLWQAQSETCDALILSDPGSLAAFASFYANPVRFQAMNARGLLVLTPDHATLIADNQCRVYAEQAHVDEIVAPIFYQGKASAPHREGLLVRAALEHLAGKGWKRIGIEAATAPAGLIDGLRGQGQAGELVDLDPAVRALRRAKDPDEVATLQKSMDAIAAGMEAARGLAPGMTEFDAFSHIYRACCANAGDLWPIYGDFASSSGGSIARRGGPPTSRTIAAGDLFILDYSIIVQGYRGDFANTYAVGRSPTDEQQKLADACIGAIAVGESMLKPGVPAREIDAAIRATLDERGRPGSFSSHCGHGIGLNHLEPPFVVPESSDTLEAGNVVTLEPGQYVEGIGGMRFERNYLITADGFELLSHHRLGLI